MITILNCPVLTNEGQYNYQKVSLAYAKELVNNQKWQSAIGHESTAKIISQLLKIECPVNRINYVQDGDEVCLVFKLNSRPSEGKILTIEEIESIGYSWYLLERKMIISFAQTLFVNLKKSHKLDDILDICDHLCDKKEIENSHKTLKIIYSFMDSSVLVWKKEKGKLEISILDWNNFEWWPFEDGTNWKSLSPVSHY